MDVELFNLTPHDVTVLTHHGPLTFRATGKFARWDEVRIRGHDLHTDRGVLPVEQVQYREVTDLPELRTGVAYLVSRVLAIGLDRDDLYFPSGEVRDDRGQVVGCRALGRFHHGDAG